MEMTEVAEIFFDCAQSKVSCNHLVLDGNAVCGHGNYHEDNAKGGTDARPRQETRDL